jgi:hypothetical protein
LDILEKKTQKAIAAIAKANLSKQQENKQDV